MEEISERELSEVLNNKYVLLVFKTKECGPCQLLHPILLALEKEFLKIHFVSMDITNGMNLCKALNISSVPTLCFYSEGKCVKKVEGYYTKETLYPFLKKWLEINEK